MTLGGYICVRNGDSLDYCWREAVASLLLVCDEVLICDSDSTDGTREAMDRLADREPKIRVINMPWKNPKGDGKWWVEWLNFAREHLKTDFQICTDADEVLSDHQDCHAGIREALTDGRPRTFNRLNFWKDASHTIPEGHAVGKWVTRFGPTSYWMPSDEGHPAGELLILDNAIRDPRLEIFHLGFLRRKDAFWRKARVVLGAFFNNYDKRLEALETAGKPLSEVQECEWTNSIVPWGGYMPDSCQRWLSDRGYTTNHYVGMTEQEAKRRVRIEPYEPGQPFTVCHCGDLGDIQHAMPTLKAIAQVTGQPCKIVALDRNAICKRIIHRIPTIAPLLLSQSYVSEFKELEDEGVQWNAGDFRSYHELTRSLAWAHLMHFKGQKSLPSVTPNFSSPWLTGILPDPRGTGRIIVNRTNRYNNRHFRWREIVQHYGNTLLFVGTQEEHSAFCSQFGHVPYQPTKDLLEVAQLIAASAMFIGNQSACFAVAEGMKHRRLLEVCLWQPDVIVTRDANLYLSADGELDLPPMIGRPTLKLPPAITKVNYLKNTNTQPRTGWSIAPPFSKQPYRNVSHSTLQRRLMKAEGLSDDAAHRAIYDALAAREPDFFDGGQQHAELSLFKQALAHV